MKYLATTGRLLAVLFLLPGFAYAQNILDTGAVVTEVFDDGFVGTDPSFAGIGFDFGGDNGLFVGNALVGTAQAGEADTQPYSGASEFTNTSPTAAIVPSGMFAYFDTGWATSFSSPLGVELHQEAYTLSGSGDQFVVFNLCAENTSGGDLDVYLGYFADWDVGDSSMNLGGVEGPIVFTWDDSGGSTNFFGFAPIDPGAALSGWTVDSDTSLPGAGQYAEMTTPGVTPAVPANRRNVMGFEMGTIANGATECATFAWAAAASQGDLGVAIALAQASVFNPPAIEPGADGTPGTHNLSPVYPNPFNPQARFTLEVAERQSVRIAVYDALGREVAILHNGTLTAGPAHEFTIDGAGMPSGVYMVRATGEQFTDALSVTLLK